jgi:hypothetical protein
MRGYSHFIQVCPSHILYTGIFPTVPSQNPPTTLAGQDSTTALGFAPASVPPSDIYTPGPFPAPSLDVDVTENGERFDAFDADHSELSGPSSTSGFHVPFPQLPTNPPEEVPSLGATHSRFAINPAPHLPVYPRGAFHSLDSLDAANSGFLLNALPACGHQVHNAGLRYAEVPRLSIEMSLAKDRVLLHYTITVILPLTHRLTGNSKLRQS